MEKRIDETGIRARIDEFSKISRQLDLLKSHVKKISSFLKIYKSENWVYQEIPGYGRSMRKITFRTN